MKEFHPFDRDMLITAVVMLVLFYLIYRFFPMQPPEMKGY